MKIYEIPSQIRQIFEKAEVDQDTGEIIFDQTAFDQLSGDAKNKVANCARVIREEEAEIAAMKEAMNAIKERMNSKARKLSWLKSMTLNAVLAIGEKVEMPDIRVSTRMSEVVQVADDAALDPAFLVVKTSTEPNKKALKDALKDGQEIAGVSLVTNYNLSIK